MAGEKQREQSRVESRQSRVRGRSVGEEGSKKCIIMHVWDGFSEKVHYNAVFWDGKNSEKALNAEVAETLRKDLREIGEDEPIRGHNLWAT
jgi:hypothetical protein